jgi:chemotaxis protein methyltransferase CheR
MMAFTYFFRDKEVLDMIAVHAIPFLKTRQYINIWDAGCAMGPEPFSLAIILRENMGRFLFRNVRIHATDVDEADFGATMEKGEYPFDQLRRIPEEIRGKYFSESDRPGHMVVSDEIRSAVTFHRHDLLSLKPMRTNFGLVVCKNVLLHFKEEQRVEVLRMFHGCLDDEGFLAMEQTQKIPSAVAGLFKPVAGNAQLFRK